jgi:hypothetical protein
MTFKEAAFQVLKQTGRPLSKHDIAKLAAKAKLIDPRGKTPTQTIASVIYTDIQKLGKKSPFVLTRRGMFGLRDWNADIAPAIPAPSSSLEEIVHRIEITQTKSQSPTEFEAVLRDAFKFLGFEAELVGGKGDTDVLLTANIGQKTFKVDVDGKTSKSSKILDSQIDWISLTDHKKKNNSDFIVVVGPSFSGGLLTKRAKESGVFLLESANLIKLLESHAQFPFTLLELKDLFAGEGEAGIQLADLLEQNRSRLNQLEQFKMILEEIQALQNRLGWFSFESLAGRDRLASIGVELEDIEYVIKLLGLPFINGIHELSEGRYVLTINIRDLANIFSQISHQLVDEVEPEELLQETKTEVVKTKREKKLGLKYFKWEKKGESITAYAREEDPYPHHCPVTHFKTILRKVIDVFDGHDVVNSTMIVGPQSHLQRKARGIQDLCCVGNFGDRGADQMDRIRETNRICVELQVGNN